MTGTSTVEGKVPVQYRRIADTGADTGERTYVIVLDEGDEAFGALTSFARDEGLAAAQLTAVGAFSRAVLGWFDRGAKDYRRNSVEEQCEVLSLVGDVALSDVEVMVRESPAQLRKTLRPDVGLALIDLSRTGT